MLYSVFWIYKSATITFNIMQDFCSSSAYIVISPLQLTQIAKHKCNRTNVLYILLECFEITHNNVLKFRILKVNAFQRLVLLTSSCKTQNSNEWFYLKWPTESILYFKMEISPGVPTASCKICTTLGI
jgi:hypothetical protein